MLEPATKVQHLGGAVSVTAKQLHHDARGQLQVRVCASGHGAHRDGKRAGWEQLQPLALGLLEQVAHTGDRRRFAGRGSLRCLRGWHILERINIALSRCQIVRESLVAGEEGEKKSALVT